MKKLVFIALVLPLGLGAMEHKKYTIPQYPDFKNPNIYVNRNKQRPCSKGVNCLLDELFRDANILTWKDVEFANSQLGGGNLIHLYQENTGNTLLHEIVLRNGNTDTLDYLLELGFDLNHTNKNEKTVSSLVAESNNNEFENIAALTIVDKKPQEKYFIPPQSSNNDNNIPLEKDDFDKSDSWYAYATLENGILSMVCVIAGGYFWRQYVAKRNEDSLTSNY